MRTHCAQFDAQALVVPLVEKQARRISAHHPQPKSASRSTVPVAEWMQILVLVVNPEYLLLGRAPNHKLEDMIKTDLYFTTSARRSIRTYHNVQPREVPESCIRLNGSNKQLKVGDCDLR
jgi:hypothetical protein